MLVTLSYYFVFHRQKKNIQYNNGHNRSKLKILEDIQYISGEVPEEWVEDKKKKIIYVTPKLQCGVKQNMLRGEN